MQTIDIPPVKTRSSRLEAGISSDQKALFQRAALLTAQPLSEFLVLSAQDAATRNIAEHENIRLSRDEQIRFVMALQNPPEPKDKMLQAAEQYRTLTGV